MKEREELLQKLAAMASEEALKVMTQAMLYGHCVYSFNDEGKVEIVPPEELFVDSSDGYDKLRIQRPKRAI